VAAGLILATGLKLMGGLKANVLGRSVSLGLAALGFAAIALLRLPLIWAVLGIGGLGMALAWQRLGKD